MKAVVFHGVGDIRVDDVPEPEIREPTDAIVRLTSSAICGTDLHFVRGTMSPTKPGTILGHEGVGVIEELGDDVRNLEVGERVAASEDLADAFKQEIDANAPETAQQDGHWKPGDAPSQALRWEVEALAKAGTLSIIGVYPPTMDRFPIGMAMNKNLTINMGNCNHRKYIPHLVELVRTGAVVPSAIISQVQDIEDALDAYRRFDVREAGWMKVELVPA